MITFNDCYSSLWNKKIVYAPNGFGKTTNANYLFDYYVDLGYRPLIFTRKKIESLVQNYGNNVFFGETAINAEENKRIIDEYKESNNVKKYFKDNYGSHAISKLKKLSFFIQVNNFKSFDDFGEVLKIDFINTNIFEENESIVLDKILDFEIYNQANILLNSKDNIKKIKVFKRYQLVDDDILKCLDMLKTFAINDEKNNCPLCGKRFLTKEKLIEAIEKKRTKYRLMESKNLYNLLVNLTSKIHELYYGNELLRDILYNFDENLLTEIKGMIKLISNYVYICQKVNISIANYFGNIQIGDGECIVDLKRQYVSNENKILLEKNNISNVQSFTRFIINELSNIISIDNNIHFDAVPNKLEIAIYLEDNQPVSSLYDVLSESEIKRFSLVVLRALIRYGKYDTLILDDPIDSYDDYYLLVACDYIKTIVKETKLINWFILTNNFTALTNISSILKCDSIIYYYNPDDIFTINNFNVEYFVATHKEIEVISKNELELLVKYLKGQLDVDDKLAYITLIVTLRNFNTLILKKYDKLVIKNGSKIHNTICAYNTDIDYCNDIKRIIEHYYMHYDENLDSIMGINSNTLEVKRIIDLFNRICKTKSNIISTYKNDLSSLCDMRKNVVHTQFNNFSGSKIIALVFIKICIVSYLKYEFEKQLITKLKNKYSYSNADISIICNINSLWKKIDKSKELSSLNNYGAEAYLKDYFSVFEKNKLLFNLFDHGLEQMFPPYIATNVKDIKKFKVEIDQLEYLYQ